MASETKARKREAGGVWVNKTDSRYKKWRASGKYIYVGPEKKRKLVLCDQNGYGRKSYNSHEEAKDRGWSKQK